MRPHSTLWAITAFYNPFRGRRRLANYRAFRRNLGVPLLAVEWSPTGDFQLGAGDADLLVQVDGGDVMWQKECLLNIALDRLPAAVRHVAWLDCDIVFADADWHEQAQALLRTCQLVQLFGEVRHLPECDVAALDVAAVQGHTPTRIRRSFLGEVARGRPSYVESSEPGGYRVLAGNPGMAFAAPVEWIRQARFYDTAVVGGGDRLLVMAALDRVDDAFRERAATEAHRRHYVAWHDRLRNLVPVRHASLPGVIYHLFHGEWGDRKYPLRPAVLTDASFDPARHLVKAPSGVWCWTLEAGEVRERVRAYLASRRDA